MGLQGSSLNVLLSSTSLPDIKFYLPKLDNSSKILFAITA